MSELEGNKEVSSRTAFMTKKQLVDLLQHMVAKLGDNGLEAFRQAEQLVNPQDKSATDEKAVAILGGPDSHTKPQRVDSKKNFDMSRYRQRQVALQVQYDGSKYYGFASQDAEDTIENHLFNALVKLNLIEDRKTCNYSRCGRTDKGVSALGQVVALKIRSSIPLEVPEDQLPTHPCDSVTVKVPEKKSKKGKEQDGKEESTSFVEKEVKEMDYCTMINHCLPEDIRIVGWCPVTEEFSARFSAAFRAYRYFFVKKDLNLLKMERACHFLVGSHDFRNICKLDIANVTNFVREIYYANISCFEKCESDESRSVWMLEIRGIAFLWHMVRCIMALLFMVGEGKEEPEIVQQLLNIEQNPAKPSYPMADDFPLVLHECGFDNLQIQGPPKNLWHLVSHYTGLWDRYSIAAAKAKNSLEFVKQLQVRVSDVEMFANDLKQHTDKTSKRLQDKGVSKRKFEEMETGSPSNVTTDNISWNDAVDVIFAQTQLSPKVNSGAHVPLLLRNKEHSYEDRVKGLVGQKKVSLFIIPPLSIVYHRHSLLGYRNALRDM